MIITFIVVFVMFSFISYWFMVPYSTHKEMNHYTKNKISFKQYKKRIIDFRNCLYYDKKFNSLFEKKRIENLIINHRNYFHADIIKIDDQFHVMKNFIEYVKYYFFTLNLKKFVEEQGIEIR